MKELLIVGSGGFLGAMARYLVYLWVGGRGVAVFPWATLAVNVCGCLLAGLFLGWMEKSASDTGSLYLFIVVGLLGGFTTFSAFGVETVNLLRSQQATLAMFNVGGNVFLGVAAVWIGRLITTI